MSLSTSLTLQVGIYRDRLTVDQSTLTLFNIKRLVSSKIDDKFPEHGMSGLVDRLILFRHDYSSTNILQLVSSASDIYDGCIVEVVISSQPLGSTASIQVRPHSLALHSYKTPTFCDWCGEMLFGMFKQVTTISLTSSVSCYY